MSGRGRSTFQKRQKEQVRLERRQQKAARKDARKAGGDAASEDQETGALDELGALDRPGALDHLEALDRPEAQPASDDQTTDSKEK